MLELMRRHRKGILGTGMIVFCALLMLVFGLGGGMGASGGGAPQVAAKIGDIEIPYRDYARNLSFIDRRMRNQLGGAYEQFKSQINIEQQAIDSSIAQAVLSDFIENNGFTASRNEIDREIKSMPFFVNNGLSRETERRFLNSIGASPEAFKNEIKKQIVSKQITDIFKDLNLVSEAEARKEFDRKHKESSFRVLKISGADFEDKVKTDDPQVLQGFYQENEELFRKPPAVQYSFVKFDPVSFRSSVEVTEDDISLEYQDMKQSGRFNVPSKVRLRQIVLKNSKKGALESMVSPESDQSSVVPMSGDSEATALKEKAEKILERLNNKEDFATIANEFSVSKNGGDLGMKSYKELNPKIATEARKMDIGEYSEAIELPDGLYIVKVEGAEDQRVKPLSEVQAEVKNNVQAGLAGEYAYAEAEQILSDWKSSSKSLEDFAKENKLTASKTEKLLPAGQVAKAGLPGLTTKVIEYGQGAKDLVLVNDTPFLIEATEFKESSIPSMEEVKEEVVKKYTAEKRVELAKAKADAILEELKKSGDKLSLTAIAEKEGLKTEVTEKASRTSSSEPVFNAANARKALFALNQPNQTAKQVFELGEEFFLAELVESAQAEGSNWEQEKDTIIEQLKNRSSGRLNAALQETLKKNQNSAGEIWINPDLKI